MTKGTGVVKIAPATTHNDTVVCAMIAHRRVFTYDGHMTGAADKATADTVCCRQEHTINELVLDCPAGACGLDHPRGPPRLFWQT